MDETLPLPSHEAVPDPAQQVVQLVRLAEERLKAEHNIEPREPGKRLQWCRDVCAVVEELAPSLGMEARRYNTGELHEDAVRAALQHGADRTITPRMNDLFGHYFDVVVGESGPYLVDLSFGQFLGDKGTLTTGITRQTTTHPNDHPMVQALLRDGFIPLTEATFRDYMQLTTVHPELRYGDFVSLDLLREPTAVS